MTKPESKPVVKAHPLPTSTGSTTSRLGSSSRPAVPGRAKYDDLLDPLRGSGIRYNIFVGLLIGIVVWAMIAYSVQVRYGLGVTGLGNIVSWGLYISNFVFFIGISHAGTLISAVLRVTHAEWRRPITRMAESITVMALIIGGLFPIIDLGRPDRLVNAVLYGRIQSPILWDFISITTYLTGSIIYLYLPLVPDIAECRDRLGTNGFRKRLYNVLSLGWTGSPEQRKHLEKGIRIMAVLIIPVAVSVHTVVSWVFAMTLRVGWHSAIFGPYFVAGAIFSGTASIIIAMAIFRRVFHLKEYITDTHFKYLGYLMLTLNIGMIYFTLNEYLTAGFAAESRDIAWINALAGGQYMPYFWFMIITGFIIPAFLVAFPKTRTVKGIVFAAVLVNIAMWLERFLIVVPTLSYPLYPYPWGVYQPTWVEWSITAGAIAGFILLYTVFAKIFPIVSRWELEEGELAQRHSGGGE